MAVTDTTYFGLTRVRAVGPEANDWAATDRNPEIISLILKAFEQHSHNASGGMNFPGAGLINWIINPSFETNTTSWSQYTAGSGTISTFARQGGWADSGAWSLRITGSLPNNGTIGASISVAVVTAGEVYQLQGVINNLTSSLPSTVTARAEIVWNSGSPSNGTSIPLDTTGTQTLSVGNATAPGGATSATIRFTVTNTSGTTKAIDLYLDSAIFSQSPVMPTYFDGTFANCTWAATPHASASISYVQAGTFATITEQSTGGMLSPGTTIGVKFSYVNSLGLETAGTPEITYTLSPAADKPNAPTFTSQQVATPGLAGGTYIYVLTKKKGSGETVISDSLIVSIPYDSLYSVTLGFEAINTYTDGTEALRLYRSSGLNSTFQLISEITSASQTGFTDTDTISPGNQNVQPPTTNTFDATRKARIDFSGFSHPANASSMKIYVTQQANLWSTNHHLTTISLTDTIPTYFDYIGNEQLGVDYPKNASQIPTNPPKVNLTTDAMGGVQATAVSDFQGYALNNVKFGGAPSVSLADGMFWYDAGANQFRGRVNGSTVTLAQAGASFSHGSEETGGHVAANIRHHAGSATPSVKDIVDRIADSSTGDPKQVVSIGRAIGTTSNPTTSLTTPTQIPEMSVSITPTFNNQWCRIVFSGQFNCSDPFMSAVFRLTLDDVNIGVTDRGITSSAINASIAVDITTYVQLTSSAHTVKAIWWVSSGTLTSYAVNRELVAELIY